MKRLGLGQKRRYQRESRLVLAGAVAAVWALIALSGSALADNFFTCTAQEVAVFPGSRIHVKCDPGDGGNGQIAFFALSVANPDVSRVLSLVETAVAGRRSLGVQYDPGDLNGTAIGCLIENCRLIKGVFLVRQ